MRWLVILALILAPLIHALDADAAPVQTSLFSADCAPGCPAEQSSQGLLAHAGHTACCAAHLLERARPAQIPQPPVRGARVAPPADRTFASLATAPPPRPPRA
jgi:hypothetical protein